MPDHVEPSGSDPGPGLAARYRESAPADMAWNPVIDCLLQHRSVRAYTGQPLRPGTLEALVATAQSAATSSNLQTWSVVAVQDQARRDRLAALAGGQKHISQAPLFLCWVADLSRAERVGRHANQPMEALPFFEMFTLAAIDAALAAQNATVAAESLGLGTVYIGGLRNQPEAVAAELGLPPNAMVVFGLCVGHPDSDHPAAVKPRLPQAAVLHHEQYETAAEADVLATYDQTLQAFQQEQGMKPQGWSELILARLGAVRGLSGRDRLRSAVEALGFGLK